jgi:hypothetical protein
MNCAVTSLPTSPLAQDMIYLQLTNTGFWVYSLKLKKRIEITNDYQRIIIIIIKLSKILLFA